MLSAIVSRCIACGFTVRTCSFRKDSALFNSILDFILRKNLFHPKEIIDVPEFQYPFNDKKPVFISRQFLSVNVPEKALFFKGSHEIIISQAMIKQVGLSQTKHLIF